MSNQHLQELLSRIQGRYSVDSVNMSMGDWICANTSLRGRPFNFKRYPFQRAIADDLHPNLDCIKPSQVGLALDLDTPIATLQGWTTMRDIQVGDVIFDEQGHPCNVTYISPIYEDRLCYEVIFDNGDVLVADENHRWLIGSNKAFCRDGLYNQTGRIPNDSSYSRHHVVNTGELKKLLDTNARFYIDNTKALDLPEAELPLDPYLLGLWLGDGSSASASLTMSAEDFPDYYLELEKRGYQLRITKQVGSNLTVNVYRIGSQKRHRSHEYDDEIATTHALLDRLGVLKDKHIPNCFLRASQEQRLDLLRGLLDTDGSVTKRGRISFHNTNPRLVEGVEHLINSLGIKTHIRWGEPGKATTICQSRQRIAEVSFVGYDGQTYFGLPRKQVRVQPKGKARVETTRRYVKKINPTTTRPVRCLTVDSPNHLFLAGNSLIPTHNTEIQVRKALAFIARNRGTTTIFTMPNEKMFERMSTTRILPVVKEEKVFNLESRSGEKPTRSKGLIQVGSSFMFVTGMTEGDATSISADAVFNDEVDLSDQSMLALFNSRLQNSDWKINQRFSTPTFNNFGVDQGYMASDSREYLCKCDSCGHWNLPLFNRSFVDLPGLPDNVEHLHEIDETLIDSGLLDLVNATVVCERCRAPLDLGREENREWVAKYPSRTHARGYRVRPFSTDRLGPDYIIQQLLKYKTREYLRGFYNTVLGEAFTAGNARLSDADIDMCFTSHISNPCTDRSLPSWIGIDVGQTCHITIGQGWSIETMHIIEFRTVPVDELLTVVQEILDTYNVIGGGVDRHPYTPTADALWEMSQGRIMPIEYRGQRDLNVMLDPLDPEIHRYAQANRTFLIDHVARLVRLHKFSFSGYGQQRSVISEHLKDMVRDETPEEPAKWVKLNGNDHYFHALAFLVGGVLLKEYEQKKFSDPRTTVTVDLANIAGMNTNLFAINRKANRGIT